MTALGLIETIGFTTAVSAADSAVKAADVEIVGMEKVIGVSGYVGVTIHFSGDVAAVQSAVEAGRQTAEMIGEVISAEVIPRAHSDVQEQLLSKFKLNDTTEDKEEAPAAKAEKEPSKPAAKKAADKLEKTETKKASTNKKSK